MENKNIKYKQDNGKNFWPADTWEEIIEFYTGLPNTPMLKLINYIRKKSFDKLIFPHTSLDNLILRNELNFYNDGDELIVWASGEWRSEFHNPKDKSYQITFRPKGVSINDEPKLIIKEFNEPELEKTLDEFIGKLIIKK